MKQALIVVIIIFSARLTYAQTDEEPITYIQTQNQTSDTDTTMASTHNQNDTLPLDAAGIKAYRLTNKIGDVYRAPMDTFQLNFSTHSLIDGQDLAVAYLANIGAPAQSRIFVEREDEHDFIFRNAYGYYITTPENALFYDAKDPYTRLTYLKAGGDKNGEEVFNGILTANFSKKLNLGVDFDYTYSRGHYASNNNKLLYYRPSAAYITDRYEARAFFSNYNYVNSENGGLTNDRYLTHPDDFGGGKINLDTKNFPTRFINTWNRLRGNEIFLTHRYNLGFYREPTDKERENAAKRKEEKQKRDEILKQQQMEEGNEDENINININDPQENETKEEDEFNAVFVPVSSIVHTFNYSGNSRRFISTSRIIDTCYQNLYANPDSMLNDYTEMWSVKNTIALSMREGFQDWIKFGFTAFVNFENRKFTLPDDSVATTIRYDEFATLIGAELFKTKGKPFTFHARGELCLVGTDLGEFNFTGELKSQFKLLGKDASVKAEGFIKNKRPDFYLNHNHSRYFRWDNSFKYLQKVHLGGEINIESTKTNISASLRSIQNFIYFGTDGIPLQYASNLQVITAKLKQNFKYKAFGWDNEIAYQLSSNADILPLPQICAYTNIYLDFTAVKVLSIQLGADARYFSSYYAPYYEPATQQFQNQNERKIGNYPIINAYANFRLKQANFFVSGYNLSALFIKPGEYFSLLHYPLNPMILKLGISVYFNN
ncbi:MAG: putative porin [Tannerella sp.]|jgi:hypothetical protein|nr:putative porin [Tannerella sp.]